MRKILYRRVILAALAGLSIPSLTAESQGAARKPATGWERVGMPAFNYNSDEGVGYGLLAEIYNYGAGLTPYKFTIQPIFFRTTKGRQDVVVFFDAPHVLPGGWRFDVTVARERQLAQSYYGVGNTSVYDSTLEIGLNPYYYRYGKTQTRVYTNLQHRIGNSSARYLFGYGLARVTTDAVPFDSGTTLFASHFPTAQEGTIGFVRTGIVWDTRDRESGPTRGTWAELLAQRVDRAFGATDEYTRVSATVRQYVPIRHNLVAAVRVLAQQTNGDIRAFDMSTLQSTYKNQEGLGGNNSVRGIARNRFIGKGVALANTELRWKFKEFSLRGKPVFLLASAFADAGRVWQNAIQVGELFEDLHTGYGGGLRIGLGPSFVVAFDYGKSKESSALYIGLGYLF